jgi:hypothetical protein
MLNEQTLNQLRALRLDGMVAALSDAATHITASELPLNNVWRCWCSARWTGVTANAWSACSRRPA